VGALASSRNPFDEGSGKVKVRTEHHVVCGAAPGTKISGGKIPSAKTKRSANRVRQALKMAAMSLSHSSWTT
jgi:hypothetical protein